MASEKPPVLYHGSPFRVERMEPRPARGVGPEHDRLTAVYASDNRQFALAFALQPPDGTFAWQLQLGEGEDPVISYSVGGPNAGGIGYLHLLPPETFEWVEGHQWVSFVPVVPVAVEEVEVDDYLHWINAAGKEEAVSR